MTNSQSAALSNRDAILKLLSDEENAKVSSAEDGQSLVTGQEYVDLERLDIGVQRAMLPSKTAMGSVLPRSSVLPDTWNKIVALLPHN